MKNSKSWKTFFLFILLALAFILNNCYSDIPDNEQFNKAKDYLYQGRLNEAMEEFNKAIKSNPTSPAFSFRAYVYLLQDNPDQAIADCDKAIEMDSKNTQAYNNRAAAFQKKGDFDKAIADCCRAIQINPRLPYPYKNRAFAYFGKKEYSKSWKDVHKAQALSYKFDDNFINILKESSGRQE